MRAEMMTRMKANKTERVSPAKRDRSAPKGALRLDDVPACGGGPEHMWLWGVLIGVLLAGCGPSLYTLPPAPPKEQWVSFSNADPEDKQGSVERFLAAKKVAIELYAALSDKRWEDALAMMSQETRNFLEDSSNGRGALAALEAGELAFGGQVAKFRPAADFFIADLTGIKDSMPAAPAENETKLRKELYATNASGHARKILFIYEADAWRFHSPFLGTPILTPTP